MDRGGGGSPRGPRCDCGGPAPGNKRSSGAEENILCHTSGNRSRLLPIVPGGVEGWRDIHSWRGCRLDRSNRSNDTFFKNNVRGKVTHTAS